MKKTLSLVLALITLLFCLVGCNNSKDIVLTDEDIHTDYAGVYLTLSSVDDTGEYKKLNAVWHNETFKEVTYGEGYKIEYLEDGEWKSVLKDEQHYVISIAYLLEAKGTKEKSYSTELFDLSKEGTYRLISDFTLGDGKMYNTWVQFEVKNTSKETTNSSPQKLVDLEQYSVMTKNGTTSIEVVYDYIEGEFTTYEFVAEDQEAIEKIMAEVFDIELKDYPDDRDIDIYQRWIVVKQGDNRFHIDLTLASDGEKQYICQSQRLREIIETYIEDNLDVLNPSAPSSGQQSAPPDDFAIHFETWIDGSQRNILDTYEGYIQKDLIDDGISKKDYTPTYVELSQLYQFVIALEYRTDLDFSKSVTYDNYADEEISVSMEPLTCYCLKFTANGKTIEISGDATANECTEQSEEAAYFMQAIRGIANFYRNTEEYKSMPEAAGGYE